MSTAGRGQHAMLGRGVCGLRGAFVLLNCWQICFFKPSVDAKIQEVSILAWSYIKDSWNCWTITAYFLWLLRAHRAACSQAFLGGCSRPRHYDRWIETILCRPAFGLFLGTRQQAQETFPCGASDDCFVTPCPIQAGILWFDGLVPLPLWT